MGVRKQIAEQKCLFAHRPCSECGVSIESCHGNRRFCHACAESRRLVSVAASNKIRSAQRAAGLIPVQRTIVCEDCGGRVEDAHGNRRYCPPCHAARHAAGQAERSRRYNERNREAQRIDARHRYRANPAYLADWQRKNRERLRVQARTRRSENLMLAKAREVAKAARRRGAEGSFTADEFDTLCAAFDGRCAYCGCTPEKLTADHIVPVKRGGTNYILNIFPACHSCNSAKRDRGLGDFLARRAGV